MDDATRGQIARRLTSFAIARHIVVVALFVTAALTFRGKALVIALVLVAANLTVGLLLHTATVLFLAVKDPPERALTPLKWWQELPLGAWDVVRVLFGYGFPLFLLGALLDHLSR